MLEDVIAVAYHREFCLRTANAGNAQVHTTTKHFTEAELKRAQWFHIDKNRLTEESAVHSRRRKGSKKKQKRVH